MEVIYAGGKRRKTDRSAAYRGSVSVRSDKRADGCFGRASDSVRSMSGCQFFCGAAAALHAEYTLPDISQSVVITRMAGRTPVPDKESIRSFAAHQATMVIFLSTGMLGKLQEELMAGGYPADTPAAIVYKATWPEEKVQRCMVSELEKTAADAQVTKTALIVVGRILEGEYERSLLYHPEFTTEFRQGKQEEQADE